MSCRTCVSICSILYKLSVYPKLKGLNVIWSQVEGHIDVLCQCNNMAWEKTTLVLFPNCFAMFSLSGAAVWNNLSTSHGRGKVQYTLPSPESKPHLWDYTGSVVVGIKREPRWFIPICYVLVGKVTKTCAGGKYQVHGGIMKLCPSWPELHR